MKRVMNRIKRVKYWALLVLMLVSAETAKGVDVSTESDLRTAVSNAVAYIRLTANITLGSTLTITSGTITLDLNGKKISLTKNKAESKCIVINGGSVKITGNGVVSAGTTGNSIFGSYPAIALSYDGGTVEIYSGTFNASAQDGDTYTLDPNNKLKVNDMIPQGAYITNSIDYNSTGLEATSTTVALTTYTVAYNPNNGVQTAEGTSSYTIASSSFQLPTVAKEGYTFTHWTYNGTPVDVNHLPTTTKREATDHVEFTANWSPKTYQITYHLDNGTNPADAIASFTIISKEIILPTPTRAGYRFLGWYESADFSGDAKKSIPKGSFGDKSYYAKWSLIFTIGYTANGGTMPGSYVTSFIKEDNVDLPKPTKDNNLFKGWYTNTQLEGTPYYSWGANTMTGNQDLYAKWSQKYTITYELNGGKNVANPPVEFSKDDLTATTLPAKPKRAAYTFGGWFADKALNGQRCEEIPVGSTGDRTYYAKWVPVIYTISYDLYYGSFPSGTVKPERYTIESENVALPMPVRNSFTFAGWYANDALTGGVQTQITTGSFGNKTFYAKWTAGSVVSFEKPEHGSIAVKYGNTEVKHGDKVGGGVKLTITAVPDPNYRLAKLMVGGKSYTETTIDTVMPASGGLTISAVFADPRPAVNAPKITLNPATDLIPSGESVMVSLQNTDEAATLYYTVGGAAEKRYTVPFPVSMLTDTEAKVTIKAIARKNGCKDGVSTQELIFRKGKVTITFTLPKGITAVNPEGGEVVSAVASGGTFEFKLAVDRLYFESLDTLEVLANNQAITPDASGVYTLSDMKGNVTVRVSGISGVTHTITLRQSANGYVCFTGEDEDSAPRTVNHGDRVSVTAKGDADYRFFSWTDGTNDNPRQVLVEKDTTIQARFVQDDPGFLVVLPTLTGAKVRPLTGYPTSVKKGGTFKFYITKEADYSESVPAVYANGEKLTVYKEVYSIYNIKENVVISVGDIRLNKTTLKLADNVVAFNLETAGQITNQAVTPTTMVYLLAKSPKGKRFSVWNDGKADNPRIMAVKDAQQLLPLFTESPGGHTLKVDLPLVPGAGIGTVNADAEAVASGSNVQLKLIVLPQYSKSQPVVKVDGKVLEPELSLRASSQTKTVFYHLNKLDADVKVELSGLELNQYTVALQQSAGGTVRASQSGVLKHGTEVTFQATPLHGNLFLKWNDGNTMNPYTYTVTGDCLFSARFANANVPLDNESIGMDGTRIHTEDGRLCIESPQAVRLMVWNMRGQVVYESLIPEGGSVHHLLRGEYILRTGASQPRKIIIR